MESVSEWSRLRFPWSEARALELTPMILYRDWVADPTVVRRGVPAHYAWWWILEGHCELEAEAGNRVVGVGEWVLIPAGRFRMQRFVKGSRIISINFFCHWAGGLPVLQLSQFLTGREETVPGLVGLANELCDVLQEGRTYQSMSSYTPTLSGLLTSRALLADFVERLFAWAATQGGSLQQVISADGRLEKVAAELRDAPKAGPLPYPRWAETTGLGRSQLERLARRDLGSGLHAYRDRFLLLRAGHLLATRPLRVKEVAEHFGFVDSAHFCRWIRQRTGHSPLQLRNAPI